LKVVLPEPLDLLPYETPITPEALERVAVDFLDVTFYSRDPISPPPLSSGTAVDLKENSLSAVATQRLRLSVH